MKKINMAVYRYNHFISTKNDEKITKITTLQQYKQISRDSEGLFIN